MTKQTAKYILVMCSVLWIGNSCKEEPKYPEDSIITTYFLIRHAEKDRTDPENKDPELNQDGLNRALRWARVFDSVDLDFIYTTDYERTTMTAAPISIKKEIEAEFYDPKTLDVDAFKEKHRGYNVLIVGHSNSTPEFVNKLLGEEKYSQMDDDDNSSLFIVRFINDNATDFRLNVD